MEDLGDAGASEITDADEPRVSNLEHGPGGELATAAVLPGSVESVDSEEKAATGEDTHMDLGVPSRQIERERSPGLSAAGRAADQHSHSDASSLDTPSATAPKQVLLFSVSACQTFLFAAELISRTFGAAGVLETSPPPAATIPAMLDSRLTSASAAQLDGLEAAGLIVAEGEVLRTLSGSDPCQKSRGS
jgi:hypothetical protein